MDQPAGPPRQITLDEAMTIAVDCIKGGRVRDAAALCRQVLEIEPSHPAALHYSGVLAFSQHNLDEALRLMEESVAAAPGQADWHSNLGIVRREKGDLVGALAAFRRAIELDPAHANACNNIGVLLRVAGDYEAAEAAYLAAIRNDPSHADAYHNLAVVLDLAGRIREAVNAYSKSLTLRPANPEGRRLLALAYCLIGERDSAVKVCQQWLASSPGDPVALHTLAACSAQDVPPRASDDYVRTTFDSFSTSFESKLARLDYRAPDLVAAALAQSGVAADKSRRVLDAGCGTGLCGPLLAPYAAQLTGVDLSPGMLAHARDKQVYDELDEAELTDYLRRRPAAFDVIVSADTLVYFGRLEDVIAAGAAALRPGGVLVFTVEEALDPALAESYAIQPHGRYAHGAGYVVRVMRAAGLQVDIDRAELRKEQGIPVAGLVVRGKHRA